MFEQSRTAPFSSLKQGCW